MRVRGPPQPPQDGGAVRRGPRMCGARRGEGGIGGQRGEGSVGAQRGHERGTVRKPPACGGVDLKVSPHPGGRFRGRSARARGTPPNPPRMGGLSERGPGCGGSEGGGQGEGQRGEGSVGARRGHERGTVRKPPACGGVDLKVSPHPGGRFRGGVRCARARTPPTPPGWGGFQEGAQDVEARRGRAGLGGLRGGTGWGLCGLSSSYG